MLCDTCASLNLKVEDFLISSADSAEKSDAFMDIGQLKEVRSKAHQCPLCRLILEAAGPPRGRNGEEEEDVQCKLYWNVDGFVSSSDSPQVWHLTVSMRPSINEFDYHRITLLADDTPEGKGLFLGRIIPPDKIKMKQIIKWMQYCIRWHDAGCDETLSSLSSGRFSKLRVIDTWRLCIVDASPECKYFTLSYVWGSATVFKLTSTNLEELATPGALKKVWQQLPRTIQDSITLTSTLHERYLWVSSQVRPPI